VTDVHSPFRSSHESSYTTNANSRTSPPPPPTARATDSDRRTDGRTDGALYRTPSDHSFRGRNTQDRQGTDTELLLDRHVARDRHRPKAVPLQRIRRTSRSDVSRPGTDIIAKHGGSRPSGRRFKAVTTLAQPDLPICFAFASTGRHQLSFALTLTPYNIWSDCDTVP